MMSPMSPTVKSFLMADTVFRQDNGKWCVIGIFDRICAPAFPAVHNSLGLFVQLDDVPKGKHQLHMAFHDGEGRQMAVSPRIEMNVPEVHDRTKVVPVGIQTHRLPIPHPGTYLIHLYFDEQHIAGTDIRLSVEHVPGKEA